MTEKKSSSFTVVGAGRSGVGISKLLASKGNDILLYDENSEDNLKYLDKGGLVKYGVELCLGNWDERILRNDVIVKSPGVPPSNEVIVKAKSLGIKVVSEIEAAYEYCPCPIVAVTGTNGKTTTTELTGAIFRSAGIDTKVCGNVGLAFSEIIDELHEDSVVVLEVSSYQLNDIENFKPVVGVMMNITPDHIDWHGSFEKYLSAKMRIAENMDDECLLVVNHDDKVLKDSVEKLTVAKSYFGLTDETFNNCEQGAYEKDGKMFYFNKSKIFNEEIMETRDINIRGKHNLYNSLAAAISARSLGIKKEIVGSTLRAFPGVEHRIEFTRELKGVKFFNDSKATNVESMAVALESFDGDLVLIMGGREKGNDYSSVSELVKNRVKTIVAVGESRENIVRHFGSIVRVVEAKNMEDAVTKAYAASVPGDNVLLSPACKSFDMFESYEHRGEVFKKIVNLLK
jgi:UDP-N-acetylmuramoylalanine--D-glutamate ligase